MGIGDPWQCAAIGGGIGLLVAIVNCVGNWPQLPWRRLAAGTLGTLIGLWLLGLTLVYVFVQFSPPRRYHYYYFEPACGFEIPIGILGVGLVAWVLVARRSLLP